jgi:hypothetical protein
MVSQKDKKAKRKNKEAKSQELQETHEEKIVPMVLTS